MPSLLQEFPHPPSYSTHTHGLPSLVALATVLDILALTYVQVLHCDKPETTSGWADITCIQNTESMHAMMSCLRDE